MEKSELVDTFNDHLSDFLSDIYKLFPENTDIQTAKNSIIAFRTIRSRKLIKNWKKDIVEPYSEEIYQGNLDFFINMDYTKEMEKFDGDDSTLSRIECLRGPIRDMSADNKEKTIKYVQNLTRLAELYK
jgi:hypothetical protein